MNFKLFIFLFATILGVVFTLPTLMNTDGKKIHLGLDLQGGTYMLLSINHDDAILNQLTLIQSEITRFCEKNEISLDSNEMIQNQITLSPSDIDDIKPLLLKITEIGDIQFSNDDHSISLYFSPEQKKLIQKNAISQSLDIVRNRLEQFGLSEPSVTPVGDDRISVELTGVDTVAEEARIRKLITAKGSLKFMAVDEENNPKANTISDKEINELGDYSIPSEQFSLQRYLVKKIPILDGSEITNANVSFDKNNQPVISFQLSAEGGDIFADFTEKNIGKRLAIVLDNKINSAPTINGRISSGDGQISGHFSLEEANDLAIALRSGSMLSPLTILEKKTIGASLGAESIQAGIASIIFGGLAVVIFMLWFYRFSGLISNIALVSNIFIIFGTLSLLNATLTLPGLAGIVLTIGMAVDSNVIISERIKELLRLKMNLHDAIENGYLGAKEAILDSNITTLIATTFLYAYGSAPLKGFAITLSIGVLSSMLTSIVGTKGIYDLLFTRISTFKHINIIGLRKSK